MSPWALKHGHAGIAAVATMTGSSSKQSAPHSLHFAEFFGVII
jgi:hypothetical protein